MRRFDYNFGGLKELLLTIPLAALVLLFFGKTVPWWLVVAAVSWHCFLKLMPVARIFVGDDLLRVEYFLPLRRAVQFRFEELASFEPINFKFIKDSPPFMGQLNSRQGRTVSIWNAGTRDFAGLCALLSERLPRPDPEQGG